MNRLAVRVASLAGAAVLAGGMALAAPGGTGVAAAATTLTAAEVVLPANAGPYPSVFMAAVSCPSAGNCTAAGTYSGGGLLVSETAGTWATGTEAPLPANANTYPNVVLNANTVSCASAGNCAAVGSYSDTSGNTQGLLLTQTAGTWTGIEAPLPAGAAPNPLVTLNSVSCTSAGNCTAVGGYVDSSGFDQGLLLTQVAGTWTAETETPPADAGTDPLAELFSVSCASAGNCTAVGVYRNSSGIAAVQMVTQTAGTWAAGIGAPLPADANFNKPQPFLESVSCSSPGNCTAVGYYYDNTGIFGSQQGLMLTQTAGTWAPANEAVPPANAGTQPNAEVTSVWCVSTGNCTATGSYFDSSGLDQGLLLTETAGTWAAGTEATPPANAGTTSPHFALASVWCSSAGNCTSVGFYTDNSGAIQPMWLTETAGTWAPAVEAPMPAGAASNPVAFPSAVSCTSAGNCVGVGYYNDSTGNTQGLLLTETTPLPTCSGDGLTIANQSPSQTGTPGVSGTWSFTVTAQDCTSDLQAMRLQGGTAGWLSNATASTSPPIGTVNIKGSQTVTWTGFPLTRDATASITVTVSGTVPKGATCGSSLPISGDWLATGLDASGHQVSSRHTADGTIQITC